MVFSEPLFLFFFLPAVFLLSRLIRGTRAQNWLLLAASLVFYFVGEPKFLWLLLASAGANYLFGLWLEKTDGKKAVLVFAVLANLAPLFLYKYLNFTLENLRALGLSVSEAKLALPLGVSFFTFQALSYVIDVYRDRKLCTHDFLKLALYILFFPRLIAGPILRFGDVAPQIDARETSADRTASGVGRFIVGLAKKQLLATGLGVMADRVFALAAPDMAAAWLGAVSYCLQLYFDFSGYSDMAIGLGRMFGFDFAENFDHPYVSVSFHDFWRRWHISLSGWFRDYIYIPLGGNRRGEGRRDFNKFVTFLATGLWHGANWTFILWGLWHWLFVFLEDRNVLPAKKLAQSRGGRALGRTYTLLAVCMGFVMFRAANIAQGLQLLGAMFSFRVTAAGLAVCGELLSPLALCTLLFAAFASTEVLQKAYLARREKLRDSAWTWAGALALYGVCVLNVASSGFTPFLYFQF